MKIIGATVGTPIKPQAVIEKTKQAKQIEDNKKAINNLLQELDNKQPKGDYALKDEIPTKPSQVGADAQGTAKTAVSTHNTDTDAHNDLRIALKELSDRVKDVLDSDDTTLDELHEIVAYIKANKSLIDSVTSSKVNVSDIINNLVTSVSNKPLSAAQGVALKNLIDALDTNKLDASALASAINTALAQAKASGDFDGKDGADGADGKSGVYVLAEGESLDDVSDDINVVIDPNGYESDDTDLNVLVQAVIGALPKYNGEVIEL